jgi:very-short-patch-repair endonuclease
MPAVIQSTNRTAVVRDPASPATFLIGIECDGASYHSSRSARDRDILRQQVLEGLGWKIYRIWSTDWFRDPEGQTKKLVSFIAACSAVPARFAEKDA